MIEYIKNIIPRIQRYSKDLSKIENFIDKNWIFIDENGINHEYLFLRDKRLIMTLGSTTKEGSWELLPTGQLLITRAANDLIKLENMFVENALLVLKRSATDDTPFVLINQQLIPDLDVVKYLEKFEYKKAIEGVDPSQQKYKLLDNGELVAPEPFIGKKIETFDNAFLNGTYKIHNKNHFLVVVNNCIDKIFFKKQYTFGTKKIIIEQKYINEPIKKDIIKEGDLNAIPIKTYFKIKDENHNIFSIKVDDDHKILGVKNIEVQNLILFVVGIIAFVFLLSVLILIVNN